MEATTLLADPAALRLEKIISTTNSLAMVVASRRRGTACPRCHHTSHRVHSRYVRRVADLPWYGVVVRLELHRSPLPLLQTFHDAKPLVEEKMLER